MNTKKLLSFILVLAVLPVFAQKQLFNGKNLKGWDTFIGTPLKGFESLKEKATPETVFSVVEKDGQKLIRISGEVNGSLATQRSYKNYHIRLEFKWGDKVYTSRNSGLLYYSFGEFGAALGTWMTNIEHQLMHERLGDTYLMNNTCCETTAKKNAEDKFQFDPKSQAEKFGKDFSGPGISKGSDAEKPLGEWNTVDLYCFGRTSVHVVNGTVVMVNRNCGVSENGTVRPLSEGKIQIQSEGAELFVRKVEIETIKEIPAQLLK